MNMLSYRGHSCQDTKNQRLSLCGRISQPPELSATIDNVQYVLSAMGVSKESISKCLIGNRFHVKLPILSPYSRIFLLKD